MEENEMQSSSYAKRPLWQWVVIYLVAGAVLYGGYYYFVAPKYGVNNSKMAVNTPGLGKFADSSLAPFAFQIFPGPMSEQTIKALIGFTVDSKSLQDGSVEVNLTAVDPGYTDQKIVVKPGYVLYFIEKNSGDDAEAENTDRNRTDDFTVLVDPQGNIAQTQNF